MVNYNEYDVKETRQRVFYVPDFVLSHETLPLLHQMLLQRQVLFWNESDLEHYMSAVQHIHDVDMLFQYIDGISYHSISTSLFTQKIAEHFYHPKRASLVAYASFFHDVGKICISQALLNSQRRFSDVEKKYVKLHVLYSSQLIDCVDEDVYTKTLAKQIALQHHERLDGSGYPHGLTGEKISHEGKIVAVADVYTALIENRPYRSACDTELALSYLRANTNAFDASVVLVLEEILKQQNSEITTASLS